MSETLQVIPDSVLRMEAVQAAVASGAEGETMEEFMGRVHIIYGFLIHKEPDLSHGAPCH